MRSAGRWFILFFVALLFVAVLFIIGAGQIMACERYEPVPPHEPTGIKGCEVYGEGTASRWGGPGVARNDCVYPWTGCQPISITSLETGLVIVVTPRMYCDCYTGTADQRIVDLDPAAVAALGLDWNRGLYPVRVEPYAIQRMSLPDTAMP